MALELVRLDNGTLPGIANAIRARTGDTALLLPSQMAAAIAGIPTVTLPELTAPAAERQVLAGKEYIGADGEKKTGTLVVGDTIGLVEVISVPGTGLEVEEESSADWSCTVLLLAEPNLLAENIKSGVKIFQVSGTAKTLRVETGSVTPAADTQSITIPAAGHLVTISGDNVPAQEGYILQGCLSDAVNDGSGGIFGALKMQYPSVFQGVATSILRGAVGSDSQTSVYTGNAARLFAAGVTYSWTVFQWEDTQ